MKELNHMKATLLWSICLLLGTSAVGLGANRYVRPGASGNGSGSDWANAYPSLPSSLIRGDIYYLATGSYGSYTFDDANSGSTWITLKKATIADHGVQTGWSDSFGIGQAVFRSWQIYTDFYRFDGVSRNSDWHLGSVNQYGIKVAGERPVRLDNGSGAGGDNLVFRYVDFQGGGVNTGKGDDVIYGLAANKNVTFQNCALHDSDRTIFLMRGEWQNLLVENSYIARNSSSPAIHGEILSDIGSDNVTFRSNVIEDPEGTAVWAVLNGGGSKSSGNTASNWKIYGNVIRRSAGYNREGTAGIFFCANDASNRNWCDNLQYYNNTHINLLNHYYSLFLQAGSGNVGRNNIFYNIQGKVISSGSLDYNWYYNADRQSTDTGANTITCTANCASYFKNIASLDATLVKPLPGVALGAEFNLDLTGKSRGADGIWDRGALEFNSGSQPQQPQQPLPLAPPTNLTLTVK